MGAIFLVRHGQASFGKADYDELSALGHQQAQYLGKTFANIDPPDTIVSGAMKRHRQTAQGLTSEISHPVPSIIDKGFNEFNHEELVVKLNPDWQDKAAFQQYLNNFDSPRKAFHDIFTRAMVRWFQGEHDDEYEESWPVFQQRVIDALLRIRNQAEQGAKIYIFTSGGPISVICQWLLKLDNHATYGINENLANAGVTRLLYNRDKLSLSYLNNYSHLQHSKASLVSFR